MSLRAQVLKEMAVMIFRANDCSHDLIEHKGNKRGTGY